MDRDIPEGGHDDAQLTDFLARARALVALARSIAVASDAERVSGAAEALPSAHVLVADIAEALQIQEKQELKDEADDWKQWVSEGIDNGARRAHSFSRAPEACSRQRW